MIFECTAGLNGDLLDIYYIITYYITFLLLDNKTAQFCRSSKQASKKLRIYSIISGKFFRAI